jgi:hypothetical protein
MLQSIRCCWKIPAGISSNAIRCDVLFRSLGISHTFLFLKLENNSFFFPCTKLISDENLWKKNCANDLKIPWSDPPLPPIPPEPPFPPLYLNHSHPSFRTDRNLNVWDTHTLGDALALALLICNTYTTELRLNYVMVHLTKYDGMVPTMTQKQIFKFL